MRVEGLLGFNAGKVFLKQRACDEDLLIERGNIRRID